MHCDISSRGSFAECIILPGNDAKSGLGLEHQEYSSILLLSTDTVQGQTLPLR